MKLALILIGFLGMFISINAAADDIRNLEDPCAYLNTRDGKSLTYKQALETVLESLSDVPAEIKDVIQNGMGQFSCPVVAEISFHQAHYLELEESIKHLNEVLKQRNLAYELFNFKSSTQATEDLESYSIEYLMNYSVWYGLGTISSNAWKYKQKQENIGEWY
jgi:hypothetical protein